MDSSSLNSLEKLHQLKQDGVITEEEFANAKAELLQRHSHGGGAPLAAYVANYDGDLPAEQDIFGWMLLPIRRYADFSGRSRRKEYWLFQLGAIGIYLMLAVLGALMGAFSYGGETALAIWIILVAIVALSVFIPSWAVLVRRLHDQDKSGWFLLLSFIPYVGAIVLLVFMCIDGTPFGNRFGEDPKGRG